MSYKRFNVKMENPWLKIPYSDYDNHMSEVGQAQILSALAKYCLEKYQPENFALAGCGTGNGLEHVKPVTKSVYAVDINPKYLKRAKENFEKRIKNLRLINKDIEKDRLKFKNVDLFFCGLVLEYVDTGKALKKIINTLRESGILFIVIQKSRETSFVTKTKYKSLEKLADISKEVDEKEIYSFLQSENMQLMKSEKIELTKDKSFLTFEYKMGVGR